MIPRSIFARIAVILACFVLVESPVLGGSFIGAAGNYGGVIDPGIGGDPENSGLIQVQIKESGALSGAVIWQSQRYALKGSLDENASFSKAFAKKGSAEPAAIAVSFTLSVGTLSISGTVTDIVTGGSNVMVPFVVTGAPPDAALSIQLQPGVRVSFIDPPNPPESETNSLTRGVDVAQEIPGDGFSVVNIGKVATRSARIVGRLPDYDGAYSAGSPLRGGNYSVFSSLYRKKKTVGGQLFGQATVQNNGDPTPQFQSQLRWAKKQNDASRYYPGAIDRGVFLDAVPYPKVKKGSLAPLLPVGSEFTRSIQTTMTFRRGNIRLPNSGGGTDRFFRVKVAVSPFSCKVVGANPYQVKVKVNVFTGQFKGTFTHPVFEVKTKFEGAFQSAILLVPGIGRGNFRPVIPDTVERDEPLESGGVTVSVD